MSSESIGTTPRGSKDGPFAALAKHTVTILTQLVCSAPGLISPGFISPFSLLIGSLPPTPLGLLFYPVSFSSCPAKCRVAASGLQCLYC